MNTSVTIRTGWAVVMAALAAGCTETTQRTAMFDPLPDPAYVAHVRSPSPRPPPPASPSPRKTESAEPWLPAKGLSDKWRYIVIHHTDSPFGSVTDVDRWHRDKGWENGCGYHFVIGNGTHSPDGHIEMGPRWHNQETGAHCRLSERYARVRRLPPNVYNERGIGIALVGELDRHPPSPAQMDALARLVTYLMDKCNIHESRMVGHGDVDQTHCPGRCFSMSELKRRVKALR